MAEGSADAGPWVAAPTGAGWGGQPEEDSPLRLRGWLARSALIVGIGNGARGDDAVGGLLADRIRAWQRAHAPDANWRILSDDQLHLEHIQDLQGRELVLFLDAMVDVADGPEGLVGCRRVSAGAAGMSASAFLSHHLTPEALIGIAEALEVPLPAQVWLVSVRGDRFELGASLTPQAQHGVELALRGLLG